MTEASVSALHAGAVSAGSGGEADSSGGETGTARGANGVRLHYQLLGDPSAQPLLMIRGLARHSLHWGEIISHLEKDFRLVLFDNRGMGRSEAPRPPYTTRVMADDAARVLAHVGCSRADVYGMSLGGMIAQELALRHPTRVRRLVLGATRSGPGGGPRIAPRVILRMLSAGRLTPDAAIKATADLALGDAFITERADVIEAWQGLARSYPPLRHGFLGQLLAGALHNATHRLGQISHATLVLTGDADRLIHADHSRSLARRIPNARLEVLPGAAHDFATEHPARTAELLREFLLR